jgi:hypothetical protein
MANSDKLARRLLSHEEYEAIEGTLHPAIYALDVPALQALKKRLREARNKMRTQTRHKQREARGKAEPRGANLPGNVEQPLKRKQIFAAALKRVSKEMHRRHVVDTRAAHTEAAQRALASVRAERFVHHPQTGRAADPGVKSLPGDRRRKTVSGARIGSIMKSVKAAQAARDNRA